jgi:protein kinase-like protein
MRRELTQVTIGSVFAGYVIEDVIGRGGMGVVYRARQSRPERTVALKVLTPEFAQDTSFRQRFERECQIAASIDHPNIVPIFEVNEEGGLLFLSMRYVHGADLGAHMKAGPISMARTVEIIAQVADALDAAHHAGLVHRDIKPGNILLSEGGRGHVYLSDFGLSKRTTSYGGLTETGQWVGTPDYVAPEQINAGEIDGRVDVYALGCVLYEALTGTVPYPQDETVAKLWAHMSLPPPSLQGKAPGIPWRMDEVIQRAMAKPPAYRFASAGDLARAAAAAAADRAVDEPERSVARGAAAPVDRAAAALTTNEVDQSDPTGARTASETQGAPADAGLTKIATTGGGVTTRAGDRRSRTRVKQVWHGRSLPRNWIWAAGALVVAVAVAAAVIGLGGSSNSRSTPGALGEVSVGGDVQDLAVVGNAVYVTEPGKNRVIRIDAGRRAVASGSLRGTAAPGQIAATPGRVWVTNPFSGTVTRFDSKRSGARRPKVIKVGGSPEGLAIGFGKLWVISGVSDVLTRIDLATERVEGVPVKLARGVTAVATGAGGVWTASSDAGVLSRIDPNSPESQPKTVSLSKGSDVIATGGSAVWVLNGDRGTVRKIDAKTRKPAGPPITLNGRGVDLVANGRRAWALTEEGAVRRIDAGTVTLKSRNLAVGSGAAALAVGGTTLWVLNPDAGEVTAFPAS